MKIVCISDTHGKHHKLQLPEGDLLIHAGDLSSRGKSEEVQDFLDWFVKQPHPNKVFVGGNHDFLLEDEPERFEKMIPAGCQYLNDSGTEIGGLKIWGSPITPWFNDWAFNRQRGAEIRRYWEMIPPDTDLLVTHGPPMGILDKTFMGKRVGCEELIKVVQQIKPWVHLFGHIHEDYGVVERDGTLFVNASCLNLYYQLTHKPVLLDIGEEYIRY